MIERGRASPSVSTLYKLADALGVPITAFFRLEPPKQEIVYRKREERTQLPIPFGIWESLGGESFTGKIEAFMVTLEAGGGSGPFGMLHTGSEFVLCLEGILEYEVETQKFILEEGDSLIFSARLRHCWRNTGNDVVKAVIIISDFEPGERPGEFHLTFGDKKDRTTSDNQNPKTL
jgi:uncharacterized cupin superfamily protein